VDRVGAQKLIDLARKEADPTVKRSIEEELIDEYAHDLRVREYFRGQEQAKDHDRFHPGFP
jgi:hypothetical protein